MRIPSASETIHLDPDEAFGATIVRGGGIRLIDRRIETRTSGIRKEVSLREDEEHCLPNHDPTVLETAAKWATVERLPPTGRFQSSVPRAACVVAALAMTTVTIALLVILPAQMQFTNHRSRAPVASKVSTATSAETRQRLAAAVVPLSGVSSCARI